ncbi:MAG: hypothetical protein JWQ90_1199 [Hydrocarboniphaga sp.]|uniref:DUF1329 domain-containing protein n=1 Tax=Hydrocarboniphaga sp. TaxID=2033016 RepID=UPI00260C2746|nr:DUF1329 domain-containing protein [Hydrocarboniphaga sp.]MDB5968749.1 hypothetical protein [Hydrocarboniphaga sp.]
MIKIGFVGAVAIVICGAVAVLAPASAAVTPEEAAQLGNTLTGWGAEKAGNKDGTIPAYDPAKAITGPVGIYKPKDPRGGQPWNDPYAAEKPLFSISKENVDKYADKLDQGTQVLLRTRPGYRVDVYPTHRSVSYPDWIVENNKQCALSAKTVGGGEGVEGAHACTPFPIPKTGYEAMWNVQLSLFPPYFEGPAINSWLIDQNGTRSLISTERFEYERTYWDPALKSASDYVYRLWVAFTAPAAKVGETNLRFVPTRGDIKDSNSWAYTPGQRRVRLAPEFKYDTVAATFGGIFFYDEISGFDGRMDRFDFKLVGKQEMYTPYNNTQLTNTPPEKAFGAHYMNPDYVRWELHRVWVVEATLKPGKRHAQSKKWFYIDEDSWNIALYDGIDQAGQVMRQMQNMSYILQFPKPYYPLPTQIAVFYSLVAGTYANENETYGLPGYIPVTKLPSSLFSPETMAAQAVR